MAGMLKTFAGNCRLRLLHFCKWRQRYGGLDVSEFKRVKELEDGTAAKRMYANLSLVHEAKDPVAKKL